MGARVTEFFPITWLASFPKSGNTWVRAFLLNYTKNSEQAATLAELPRIGRSDALVSNFHKHFIGPVDWRAEGQVLSARRTVLRGLCRELGPLALVKTHHERRRVRGYELIPADLTARAVYILRHPCAVVLSFADHFGLSLDQAAAVMARRNARTRGNERMTTEYIGSWSDNVRSWTGTNAFPVLVLHYEELCARPLEAFARLLRFLGLTVEPERLERAIRFSDFAVLRRQEDRHGFVERSRNAPRFFRAGPEADWKTVLPQRLARSIRETHGEMIDRFGYAGSFP